MNPIFKKLNYKNYPVILSLFHPNTFQKDLDEMCDFATIVTNIEQVQEVEFVIAFATKQVELDSTIDALGPKLKGDAIVWFCYPKGTSKKYKCDFNRDTGWTRFGQYGLEPVRMVAIDEDWSALRFRKVSHIKTITRAGSQTLTEEAKRRTTKKDT